eukprot:6851115-Karenia_brevis.AAC.1
MHDVLGRVLQRGVNPEIFAGCEAAHKPSLMSAVSGGQWPQVRLADAGLVDDSYCQLCHSAVGTLAHRHQCPATMPH